MRFPLIQLGLIDITPEEGVKRSRPTSSLIEEQGCRILVGTVHPKEDGQAV
jgi:hypothetical protein